MSDAAPSSADRRPRAIGERLIENVCRRLAENEKVRRSLRGWGRIHIDRQLPFLCVYRRPSNGDDAGTERLVTSEASYLVAPGAPDSRDGLRRLLEGIVCTLGEQFGAFLLLELWSGEPGQAQGPVSQPRFRIFVPDEEDPGPLVDAFDAALSRIELKKRRARVEVISGERPRGAPRPILPADVARTLHCHVLGLEVRPVYRDRHGGAPYPLLLRGLRRSLSHALRRTFYAFTHDYTSLRPVHFHVLGRRAVVRAVWDADRRLAEVADRFDFLLQITPFNPEQAWQRFCRAGHGRAPVFHYRPLPVEPAILKRLLFETPLERVEDPALHHLLREKQDELDRQITLLTDIDTPRFVHGSVQLFGGIEDELVRQAAEVLEKVAPESPETEGRFFDGSAFARQARAEIGFYRRQMPELDAKVTVRSDVSSLMVSKGSLLVGRDTRIPVDDAEAFLQHEVGTHVLTYYNARQQPLRQLYSGLAGYNTLQEGLAVLAEYLVSGLSRSRLRVLAARVVSARRMLDGASFLDTFHELERAYGFDCRTAFMVTMRNYRGGGLTKDAVYLRGLVQLLDYLRGGGTLQPLFIGKIDIAHVPIMRELQLREVLRDPPLEPRYMTLPETAAKLERLGRGMSVLELLKTD